MAKIDVSLLSERVYHAVREAIFSQSLRPATRLDVHRLAAAYGTSAAPVRQALARLHEEGMVEILPRRGTFVTSVRPRDVVEVFQIRRIVELGVVDLLDGRLPPKALERLGQVVELTEALAVGESFRDYAAYIQFDAEFHRLPILAVENARLLRTFDSLHAHMCIARGLYPTSNKRATSTLAEHRAIFGAYQTGSVTAVKDAILAHLRNGESDLARRLAGESDVDWLGASDLSLTVDLEAAPSAVAQYKNGKVEG